MWKYSSTCYFCYYYNASCTALSRVYELVNLSAVKKPPWLTAAPFQIQHLACSYTNLITGTGWLRTLPDSCPYVIAPICRGEQEAGSLTVHWAENLLGWYSLVDVGTVFVGQGCFRRLAVHFKICKSKQGQTRHARVWQGHLSHILQAKESQGQLRLKNIQCFSLTRSNRLWVLLDLRLDFKVPTIRDP